MICRSSRSRLFKVVDCRSGCSRLFCCSCREVEFVTELFCCSCKVVVVGSLVVGSLGCQTHACNLQAYQDAEQVIDNYQYVLIASR